ncbi:hypothetical protein CRG98_000314 [Punica granatum]|uniref:Uncharacterized protein n=1 Tax=Punica granatum TaxID=22663 RepID=A0A2I0LF63_PUNGR|nr:hypothetical protein CRG98_000314 [Punica granatum]
MKYDSAKEGEDPLREIEKLALVSGNLEIGKPSPENPKILPDSDCLNAGEAPIDNGEAQAVPRAISRVHFGPHRGVQGRKPPPAAPWPLLPPDPDRPWLTGLDPVCFFLQAQLGSSAHFGPTLQSGPALFRAVSPSGELPNLIRPDCPVFFFLFTEKPLSFPD